MNYQLYFKETARMYISFDNAFMLLCKLQNATTTPAILRFKQELKQFEYQIDA